jgi:hydrogenase nickel incorporation protein HypA/HybF
MHEMALAEAVVAAAVETAEKHGISRITRIEVRVGELQQIERETFRFAIEAVIPAEEPRLAGAVLDVQDDPAAFLCRRCGRDFGMAQTGGPTDRDASEAIHFLPELAHAYLRCPACSSPDFEVTAGRGVRLGAIEGD